LSIVELESANFSSRCGQQTFDHAIIFFKPWSETGGLRSDTKFNPFERTSGINSKKNQYLNSHAHTQHEASKSNSTIALHLTYESININNFIPGKSCFILIGQ